MPLDFAPGAVPGVMALGADALPVKSISKANVAKKVFMRDMDITKLLNVVVEDVAKAAISLALARLGRQTIPIRESSSVFRPH